MGKTRRNSADLSHSRAVIFTWKPARPETGGKVHYRFELSLLEDFSTVERRVERLTQCHAAIRNLKIGTTYFWRVTAYTKHHEGEPSLTRKLLTSPSVPRWISAPGITNMRDIGGWSLGNNKKVGQGLIYRSSAPRRKVDRKTLKILVEDLKIRKILDLRNEKECKRHFVQNLQPIERLHFPIPPYHDLLTEEGQKDYLKVLQLFANSQNYPILCHCLAGADRMGTLVVLILGLLGADEKQISLEYELTSFSVWGLRSSQTGPFQKMLEMLRELDFENGDLNRGIEIYAHSIGMTDAEIARIRKILTE